MRPQYKMLEDARLLREAIETSVSTCGLQRHSNKSKLRSNDAAKSPRQHIKHINSHNKEVQRGLSRVPKVEL